LNITEDIRTGKTFSADYQEIFFLLNDQKQPVIAEVEKHSKTNPDFPYKSVQKSKIMIA